MAAPLYHIPLTLLSGQQTHLKPYEDRVLLIVNTASKCGFTPQYRGLEQLWQSYRDRGLVVLGFPCNQFGAQEPRDANVIADFCERSYGVTFPMFAKLDVNGERANPLFKALKQAAPGALGLEAIKWNFTKFLVGRHGRSVQRFAPITPPDRLVSQIERTLGDS